MFAKILNAYNFVVAKVTGFIGYVKLRLAEKSTWAGIIGGFSGASALDQPWDYLAGAAGAVMAIIPTSKKDEKK